MRKADSRTATPVADYTSLQPASFLTTTAPESWEDAEPQSDLDLFPRSRSCTTGAAIEPRFAKPVNDALERARRQLKDLVADLQKTSNISAETPLVISGGIDIELRIPEPHTFKLAIANVLDEASPTIVIEPSPRIILGDKNIQGDESGASFGFLTSLPREAMRKRNRQSDEGSAGDFRSRKKVRSENNDNLSMQQSIHSTEAVNTSLNQELTVSGDNRGSSTTQLPKQELLKIWQSQRDDIQEDTADVVNHVHHFLQRWKKEWHEKNSWLFDYFHKNYEEEKAKKDWMAARFKELQMVMEKIPYSRLDHDTGISMESAESMSQYTRLSNEIKALSKQIRWVEECRKIADDAHHAREEKWRESSATFHDHSRREREQFEKWIVTEIIRHGQIMTNMTKDIKGLYPIANSLKWEPPTAQEGVAPAFDASQAPPPDSQGSNPTTPINRPTNGGN